MVMRKKIVNKRKDKKRFSVTAGNMRYENLRSNPKRGGYRL